MALLNFCRVILLCFTCVALSVCAYSDEPAHEIRITNTLTENQDSLYICQIQNNKTKKCHEIMTSIPLANPIGFSVVENKIFIANYGSIGHMGTSFILRCELPKFDSTQTLCESVVALASASHITGIAVFSNNLFFVKSRTTGENFNFNTLSACPLPMRGRVTDCHHQIVLPSLIPNPQSGYNTIMPITVTLDHLTILDEVGGTIFECLLPDRNNEMSCQARVFMEVSPLE